MQDVALTEAEISVIIALRREGKSSLSISRQSITVVMLFYELSRVVLFALVGVDAVFVENIPSRCEIDAACG